LSLLLFVILLSSYWLVQYTSDVVGS